MAESQPDRFVRFPLNLLEALLRARLSGTQWRILLWVVRHTYGWNRGWTPFSWYRIAKETGLDRAAAYRAGTALMRAQILVRRGEQIAIELDSEEWGRSVLSVRTDAPRRLWTPGINIAREQRRPLPLDNAPDVARQRNDCQATTLFRRVKDRCKDRLKTYKDRSAPENKDASHHHVKRTDNTPRQLLAGSAQPIPGKYDGIPQD